MPRLMITRPLAAPPLVGWILGALILASPLGILAQGGPNSGTSREERLRQHRERINKILEERRRQEGASAQPAPASSAAGSTAASTPGAAAQPGVPPASVRPTENRGGNIPPATGIPGAPGQPVPGQPAAPAGQSAARSEARAILALFPFDSSIQTGDTFETEVIADARVGKYDQVSFVLSWNPLELNPLAMDHSALATLGVKDFEYGLDQEKGLLAIKIKFPESTPLGGQPLVKMVWEGLRPTPATGIRFRFDADTKTGIFAGSENFLGTAFAPDDGVLHSTVLVRARQSRTQATKTADGGVLLGGQQAEVPDPEIRLTLETDRSNLRTGESAVVSVRMSNPKAIPFDRLRLYLQFDPSRVEILDTDRGNGIRSGTNIREPNRDLFPFDYLRANEVTQSKGLIELDAGTENRSMETTGGVLAQIGVRALKSGPFEVTLVRNAAGLGPDTDIYYLGTSVLKAAKPSNQPTVLDGVRLRASGPQVAPHAELDNPTKGSSDGSSQVVFSSGLGKQRQFGSVQLIPSQESSEP